MIQSRSGKIKKGGMWYLCLGFLVPALVSLLGYILIKVWPFGDGTVLIIDSLHQYLPFYTDFHEKLVNHQSLFYSFGGGFGYDFWSTYAYYMASPFNFLIALVPTANVGDFMDYMILLKIGLCGGIFSWYLYKRDPGKYFMPVVFGSMYALGNFIIGYYFNLMWLDSIAVLPLVMYGIEKIAAGKGGKIYGFALFYAIWCNYYIGFMLCIFSCMYLVVAFLEQKKITVLQLLKRSLLFGWYSLLGGGMASLVLVPAYVSLLSSESMTTNSFPSTVKFYVNFVELMVSHFAAEHPINISDSQVGLNAYCGVIVLILVLLYILDEKIRVRVKIGRLVVVGFLLLSFSMNILNYIWHGFHTQNGLPNRFAFLYVCMILVLGYDVIGHFRRMDIWKILMAGLIPEIFSVAAIYFSYTDWDTYGVWNYLTPIFLVLYLIMLLLLRISEMKASKAYLLLGSMMLLEAIAHGIYGFEYNENVTRSIYLKDQASYKELMKEQGDTDFFRSEFDSQRMRNVALFSGAYSTVLFNSTMSASITEFCDRLGIEARTNKNGYLGVTGLMNDVFGIRYVLSSIGKGDAIYGFEKVNEDGNLALYKNEDALSIGFLVNSEILYWEPEDGQPIENQEEFLALAADLESIFTYDRTITAEDGENYQILVPEGKRVYLYVPTKIDKLELHTPEYDKNFSTYTDHLYVIDSLGEENIADFTVHLKDSQSEVRIEVYTCPDSALEQAVAKLGESQLQNVIVDGNHLKGDIDADHEGILMLTIPADEDWTILVDGEPEEMLTIGGAMIGVEVEEGHHTVEMNYVPGGFREGKLMSITCILLFLGTCILEKRRLKKMPPDADDNEEYERGNSMDERVTGRLIEALGEENVRTCENMNSHTTFRIGGPADYFVTPANEDEIRTVLQICKEEELPVYILGNGSNLLVGDKGIRGLVLQLYRNRNEIRVEGNTIYAQSGAMLSAVARTAMQSSLAGLAFASGIPGTIGGAVMMNAGAYGGEMKDVVKTVRVMTRDGEIQEIAGEDMAFGYRTSIVEKNGYIVLDVVLVLEEGNREEILARMEELRGMRQEKQPLDLPSAGSTFKRPEGYFAGKLIMDAGLRGFRVGDAKVSEKHCGFVVNAGEATAKDVTDLMEQVSDRVYEQFQVRLEPEVKRIGEFI